MVCFSHCAHHRLLAVQIAGRRSRHSAMDRSAAGGRPAAAGTACETAAAPETASSDTQSGLSVEAALGARRSSGAASSPPHRAAKPVVLTAAAVNQAASSAAEACPPLPVHSVTALCSCLRCSSREASLRQAVRAPHSAGAGAQSPGVQDFASASGPRVAYQGMSGAYSELAACRACPDARPLPCEQFEMAFQVLSQWMADRAVLPIENIQGGSNHAIYDLLMRWAAPSRTAPSSQVCSAGSLLRSTTLLLPHGSTGVRGARHHAARSLCRRAAASDTCAAVRDPDARPAMQCRYHLHIVGELCMDVEHCLLALPGVQEGDITRVMTHPLALAQCDAWLQQRPHLTRQAVNDTALAAKTIATQGLRWAALWDCVACTCMGCSQTALRCP